MTYFIVGQFGVIEQNEDSSLIVPVNPAYERLRLVAGLTREQSEELARRERMTTGRM